MKTSHRPSGLTSEAPGTTTTTTKAKPERRRMSTQQRIFWRAAEEAAKAGDLIKALLLFEAGRVA